MGAEDIGPEAHGPRAEAFGFNDAPPSTSRVPPEPFPHRLRGPHRSVAAVYKPEVTSTTGG
jgi:hypothetical protein